MSNYDWNDIVAAWKKLDLKAKALVDKLPPSAHDKIHDVERKVRAQIDKVIEQQATVIFKELSPEIIAYIKELIKKELP
jgi:hypothetical protein